MQFRYRLKLFANAVTYAVGHIITEFYPQSEGKFTEKRGRNEKLLKINFRELLIWTTLQLLKRRMIAIEQLETRTIYHFVDGEFAVFNRAVDIADGKTTGWMREASRVPILSG